MTLLLWIYVIVGLAAVHAVGVARRDVRLLGCAAVLDVVVVFLVGVAIADPARFEAWMQEDGWIEWATFYAFAAAAVVAAVTLRHSFHRPAQAPSPRWLFRAGLAGLALFCAFVALEEISWGQRIFAFEPPEAFLAENFQQELNLHNLLQGKELAGVDLDSRYLVAIIAIGFGIVIPAAGALARRSRRLRHPLLDELPPLALSPWFAAVALAELAYPVSHGGEACELVLGILFLTDALNRRAASDSEPALTTRRNVLVPVAAVALALITGPVLDRAVYGSDDARAGEARIEVDQLRADVQTAGVPQPKLSRRNVHKRLYTAVRRGYLAFGDRSAFLGSHRSPAEPGAAAPRADRRGYFLDPWRNAYWIHHARASNQVVIYSFGPNRRRDSELAGQPRLTGDDIGVVFSLPRPELTAARPD